MSQEETAEYEQTVESLGGDKLGRRSAWAFMEQSNAVTGKGPSPISFLPVVYNATEKKLFQTVSSQAYCLMTHIMELYKTQPGFRSLFRFDPRVRKLLQLNSGCSELLPVSRLDAIYNPQTKNIRFCEFNTNASGGVAEAMESLQAVKRTRSFAQFSATHPLSPNPEDSLMDSLTRNFRNLYDKTPGAVSHPQVAIAVLFDTPEACVKEISAYIPYFNKYGMECSVFDVRNLKYIDGNLVGTKALAGQSNVRINAVWNFLIVVDLLAYWDEIQDFLSALQNGAVMMMGSFLTQVVHDKQLFALLHDEQFQSYLTAEEKSFVEAHIPPTYFIDALQGELLEEVKTHREDWIIKPCDWYASQKVHSGRTLDEEQWNALIDTCMIDPETTWIVQQFFPSPQSACIPLHGEESEFTAQPVSAGSVLGLFLYSGTFSGVYMRQGLGPVIGTAVGELCAPVLWTN